MNEHAIDQWDEHYPTIDFVAEDIENGTLYIVEDEEQIVGIVTLDEFQHELYRTIEWEREDGKQLIIHRLAVLPQEQGKGIARKLMDFAEGFAAEHRYTSIRFDAYNKNDRALRLYKELGYAKKGEVHFEHRTTPFSVFEKIVGHSRRS
jgi:ribosomal protein S18 acetylase RimI-like enzyme